MPDMEVRTGGLAPGTLPALAPNETAACANCGTLLTGPYCSTCGQHVADFHRSVWRFVSEFFDNTLCWDNKLLLTLEPLFKQPGFLTREFMRGRRMRYVHPLRLFLFTSAVCLALLKYGHGVNQPGTHPDKARSRKGAPVHLGDAASAAPTSAPVPADARPADASPSAALTKKPADKRADGETDPDPGDGNALANAIQHGVADNLQMANKGRQAGLDVAAKKLESASSRMDGASNKMARAADNLAAPQRAEHLSWVALALLPVFALGLQALYRRGDHFYFEHLIFSLHYHVFLLLFWTGYVGVMAVASYLPLHGFFEFVVRLGLLVPPIYLYVALRRIYGEGVKRTVCKVLLLGSVHLLAIVIGAGAVGAAAILSTTE